MALELSLESKVRPAAPSGAVCREHRTTHRKFARTLLSTRLDEHADSHAPEHISNIDELFSVKKRFTHINISFLLV